MSSLVALILLIRVVVKQSLTQSYQMCERFLFVLRILRRRVRFTGKTVNAHLTDFYTLTPQVLAHRCINPNLKLVGPLLFHQPLCMERMKGSFGSSG